MRVMTDLVVASRKHSLRVFKSSSPRRDFDGIDARGIDTQKLQRLHDVLRDERTEAEPFSVEGLHCGGDNGPWVFELPETLVQQLVRLSPKRLREAGQAWAAAEEFSAPRDHWHPEAVQQTLAELTLLAKRSVRENKPILMWMGM